MKKIIYSVSLLMFLSISINVLSQNQSKIKPVKIIWIADGTEISIEKAQKGIPIPTNLSIAVVLDNNVINKLEGQKLEFKWFRRGATRDYLTNSFIKQISSSSTNGNVFLINAGRSNLKKGWWKVQIEAYIDRELLSFENKQEFWINLL
ncbi:MAG: hypothetical protein JXR51_03040 [Bacteroidales bacterium]|nr:hypothetical protein [Bacteroidales bacterium]MBN2756126.1 hypothetical protein [Bacteroidales bacterium]